MGTFDFQQGSLLSDQCQHIHNVYIKVTGSQLGRASVLYNSISSQANLPAGRRTLPNYMMWPSMKRKVLYGSGKLLSKEDSPVYCEM